MSFDGVRQVGEFIHQRPMIRSLKNPMDKTTIVSIYPKRIEDVKETLFPGRFVIEAGNYKDPSVTIIEPSSWFRDIDIEQPLLEIPVSSIAVAQSIIVDYCNGMLGCDMNSSMPGMFFIPGEFTKEQILKSYSLKLAETKLKQDSWFKTLVRLGNSLWARSNGNPLVIWDEMRMAARELNQENLPWLKMDIQVELVPCFACGTLRNGNYPVCQSCRAIDMNHPAAKELKFAQH